MEILLLIAAYLCGSIPFGLLIARCFCQTDLRACGSGNVGATNVARTCGKKWGAVTLVCDVLKGAAPVFFAMYYSHSGLYLSLVALAAILGHLYSCFLHFTGGKAVATSIGVLIPLAFGQLLVAVVVCLFIIWRTGFVSLGSLTLVTLMPLLLLLSGSWSLIPLALVIMTLVYWSHRENIRRLARSEEKVWTAKKSAA